MIWVDWVKSFCFQMVEGEWFYNVSITVCTTCPLLSELLFAIAPICIGTGPNFEAFWNVGLITRRRSNCVVFCILYFGHDLIRALEHSWKALGEGNWAWLIWWCMSLWLGMIWVEWTKYLGFQMVEVGSMSWRGDWIWLRWISCGEILTTHITFFSFCQANADCWMCCCVELSIA